jgi:GH24 family phage-related lysozyme (muramidase)
VATSSTSKTYHGNAAVRQVRKNLGRDLTNLEKRIVMIEGYVAGEYRDTVRSKKHPKGVRTSGVGQTGDWIEKGFPAALEHHVQRAKKRVTNYDNLPEYMQNELVQSEYRGDLALKSGRTSKAVNLFNKGEYSEAADEFLRHDEYLNPDTSSGIKERLKATSDAMRRYGKEELTLSAAKQFTDWPSEPPMSLHSKDYA